VKNYTSELLLFTVLVFYISNTYYSAFRNSKKLRNAVNHYRINNDRVIRAFAVIMIFFQTIVCTHAHAQQPALSVQSFEYIWQKEVGYDGAKEQFILAADDSVKHSIEKSFARAIQQRWNIEPSQLALSVKPLSIFYF
jgi:hypothetical protein